MNLMTKIYVHIYCAYYIPKSWINYCLYCVLQNKTPNQQMLMKLIHIKSLVKTFK